MSLDTRQSSLVNEACRRKLLYMFDREWTFTELQIECPALHQQNLFVLLSLVFGIIHVACEPNSMHAKKKTKASSESLEFNVI